MSNQPINPFAMLFSALGMPEVQNGISWLVDKMDELEERDHYRHNLEESIKHLTRLYELKKISHAQFVSCVAILTQPTSSFESRSKLEGLMRIR
jgi:hypothetical protein